MIVCRMSEILANIAGAYIEDKVHGESLKVILQHLYEADYDELLVLNCASAGLRRIINSPMYTKKIK